MQQKESGFDRVCRMSKQLPTCRGSFFKRQGRAVEQRQDRKESSDALGVSCLIPTIPRFNLEHVIYSVFYKGKEMCIVWQFVTLFMTSHLTSEKGFFSFVKKRND